MKQSRKASLIEAWGNVIIGYLIQVFATVIIFPWFNIHIPLKDNFLIGLPMTVISIVRSYMLRRGFEFLRVEGYLQ